MTVCTELMILLNFKNDEKLIMTYSRKLIVEMLSHLKMVYINPHSLLGSCIGKLKLKTLTFALRLELLCTKGCHQTS